MTRGEISNRTSGVGSGAAALEIIAPVQVQTVLRRMLISLAAATASTYGLGRPAAAGITPTTPLRVQSLSGGQPAEYETRTALAWATGPTVPAQFFRRWSSPNVIGSFIEWTWDCGGLIIPAGTSLVLWNLAANGVVDVDITTDE